MDPRYDVHIYGELYREEAMRDARERNLLRIAKAKGRPGLGRSNVGFTLGSVFGSLLRRARLAG